MAEIVIMGELLVEIMRAEEDVQLLRPESISEARSQVEHREFLSVQQRDLDTVQRLFPVLEMMILEKIFWIVSRV